ncbi:MAG TPA: DUF4347 domain-containing protein [Trichocoleus sp.]|jgi:Ca2+-binding RTX toxin-like protein
MTSATSQFLIVADPSVPNYRSLLHSVPDHAEVLVLDPTEDGVAQITRILADRQAVQSLHILSHGAPGAVQLGSARLSWDTLAQYSQQIRGWFNTCAAQAEILLYGCEVAAGKLGQQFVQQLSQLTGASIAASATLTGNAVLGGDWRLEYQTGAIRSPLAFSAEAMTAYAHVLAVVTFLNETFSGDDVTGNWLYGVGDPTDPLQANPFLTARATVTPSATGIPGNPGTTPFPALDAIGSGALRLTNATGNQAAFVLYNTPVQSDAGLRVTFDMFQYGGTGADGINFFLVDGATQFPTTPRAGAFGGSLGYAQKTNIPGIDGGYLGIGFDAFGNYARATEGRVGGVAGVGQLPDTITVRGSAATQYAFLTSTGTLPFGLDVAGATGTRATAQRRVQVDLAPTGLVNVAVDLNNNNVFTDPGETLISNYDIRGNGVDNGAIPDTLKFGFAAGTGDFTNVHEIRNLNVQTFTSPPETTDSLINLAAGTTANVTGLAGTDADGTVESFRILTLPLATQGTLFLGDPASGGRAIASDEVLTPAQISQVYFQAANGFTGTSFTYTAVDNLGAEDLTPGVVTLNPLGVNGGGNLPPDTNDASIDLPQDSLVNLVGLSGTDSDGSVASFTIVTAPSPDQGTLYLGNPDEDGTPIQAGTVLTPAQINQLYFESSTNFQGSSFTYAATDNLGSTDPTPATVELGLSSAVGPLRICRPGKQLTGNRKNNRLTGGKNRDMLVGEAGNDLLRGRACNDMLRGDRGSDVLMGGAARDTMRGNQGSDRLLGNNGSDLLDGGLGDDTAAGGKGIDEIFGRRGNDRLQGRNGNDRLMGGRNNDRLSGGSNVDVLDGQQGSDVVNGDNGIDTINGGLGRDRLFGGKKADAITAGRANDIVKGNGDLDVMRGQKGNDRIYGGSQADRILGGLGRDFIIGGGGADVITGGGGRDRFIYRNVGHGADQILDFQRQDQLDLRSIVNKQGYSSNNRFRKYVRLQQSGGSTIVQVDSNGNAAGGFQTIATLSNTATPFTVRASNFILS